MLLKIQGVVRLASDVEIKYTQSGSAIANFSIVSSNKYKTQSGEQKEDTCFIEATAFGRLAEICNQYLRKGSQIKIDGELKQDTWEKDGQKRSKHTVTIREMEMLGSKSEGQNSALAQQNKSYETYVKPDVQKVPDIDVDEELPF